MGWWFVGQEDISQLETLAIEEEGETQMVVEINRIKGGKLCYYNRTLVEAILMVVNLRIGLWPVNMFQLDP